MLPEFEPFAAWLSRRFPGSETRIHYLSDLALIQKWLGKPVADMLLADTDRYIDHALALGHKAVTIKRRLAAVMAYFDFLDLFGDAPVRCPVLWRRHRLKQPQRLPRDVSDAVVSKVFDAIKRPRDRAMFALMYVCGLRLGEVRALRLSGLSLERSAAALPRVTFTGKGAKERSVPVGAFALAPLRQWLAERPNCACDAVFLTRDGKPFSTTSIRRLLARYCAKAGVSFTCHQLRHAFARLLAERGVPAPTLQQLLGHKYLETTQIYITVSDPVLMSFYDAAMAHVETQLPFVSQALIAATSMHGAAI